MMEIFYKHGINSKNELVICASHNKSYLLTFGKWDKDVSKYTISDPLKVNNLPDSTEDHKQTSDIILKLVKTIASTYNEQDPPISRVHWISDLNLATKNKEFLQILIDDTLLEIFKDTPLKRTVVSSSDNYVEDAIKYHQENHPTSPITIRPLVIPKGKVEEDYHSDSRITKSPPPTGDSKEEVKESPLKSI